MQGSGLGSGIPLLDNLVGLGASVTGVSAGSLFLYASAATGAYALYEQIRFRMARCDVSLPQCSIIVSGCKISDLPLLQR